MSPFLEVIGGTLVKGLVGEVAGSVRRKLGGDPAQAALKKAVSEALEGALRQSGLSPESLDHSEGFFRDLFGTEAVHVELALLLDPRPDVSLNLDRLAEELEEGGLDHTTLPGFELKKFLSAFALDFYSAAGKQDALRGVLDLKMLGSMVDRLGAIDRSTERSARASERMADGVERLNENVEGLRRELPEFVAGRVNDAALLGAVYTLGGAGMIPAFDGWRLLEKTVHEAGYDVEVDREGRLRIAGAPSEERALPPARLGTLERVAAELRRAVDAQQPSPADLDALAKRYRQHVVRWFQHLSFQGMTPSARAILLPLEEVYVELRAVAEVPEAADSFSVEERRLLLEVDERDPKAKDELLRQLDVLRRERWGRSVPERKSIAAALYQRDQRAFVILGDPGSGKSTLLHFLALVHAQGAETTAKRLEIDPVEADRLPIFVSLAAFDDMLRESPGLTLLDFLPRYYDRRRGLPGLGPLFLRALETGRALVLLDGLDEVLDAGTRGYVAQQAGALIGEWSPRGVRFAVSSRFVGYREAPLPGSLPTLSVLDFGEKEIEVFVHRWSHAYETWAAGEATPEALRKARELERDLLEDIRSNDSVRRLAANPLMLTLLALLRRQVGKLPHRRVQLYEAYVSTMLDNWLAARSQGAREKSVVALDRHQAENILIPMALWLQRERPSGTAGRAELESTLTEICLKEKGYFRKTATIPQLREAEEHARRFLREMREMTGLLLARGYDAFGFLHLTFQEYFAGRGLALLGADERWEVLHPHLHDPRWREPILLCAGRLGVAENRRKEVTAFVRRILSSPDPTESDLHRNLLLALAIACDDMNLDPVALEELIEAAVQCLPTEVYAFARLVLGLLTRLIADGVAGASLERCMAPVWQSGDSNLQAISIGSMSRFAEKPEIRFWLIEKLGDGRELVRCRAVEALAGSASDSLVRRALLEHLKDVRDVRDTAIRSLAGLLPDDRQVLEEVLECLGDSGAAAQVLAGVMAKGSEIRSILIERSKNSEPLIRSGALIALSGLVAEDAEVRALAMTGLADEDLGVRYAALSAVTTLPEDHEVRCVLIRNLDTADFYVRREAFWTLTSQLGRSAEIDSVVLSGLEDEDEEIREAAVNALAAQVVSDKAIRHAIVGRLEDASSDVRRVAVNALAACAVSDEAVRQAVLKRLEDPATAVRGVAMRALVPLLQSADICNALFSQTMSGAWIVRDILAQILGENSGAPGGLPVLLEIRDKEEALEASQFVAGCLSPLISVSGGKSFVFSCLSDLASTVRVAAIRVLREFSTVDAQIRGALLVRLGDDGYLVRQLAVDALSVLLGTDAEVRGALLASLGDDNESVRQSAVEALSVLLGTDAEVREALLARLGDDDESVRRSAVEALSVLLGTDTEVRGALLDRLGDDDESVRQPAMEVLSVLLGTDAEVRGALLDRLGDNDESVRRSAVEALSVLLGTDAEVRGALLARLGDNDESVRQSAVEALSVLLGTDAKVRGALLDRLSDDDEWVRQSAVSVLSALLGTDAEVREALLAQLRDDDESVRRSAVEALSVLLGTDAEVRGALLVRLGDDDHLVRRSTVFALSVLLEADAEVRGALLARLGDNSSLVRQSAVDAVVVLLGTDEAVRTAVLEAMTDVEFGVRGAAAKGLLPLLADQQLDLELLSPLRPWIACEATNSTLVEEIRKQFTSLVSG